MQGLERLGEALYALADVDVSCGVRCLQVQVALRRVEVVLRAVANNVGVYGHVSPRRSVQYKREYIQ